MKILLDADSCPRGARDIVIRRAIKQNLRIILAANRAIPISVPDGLLSLVEMEICSSGENAADDRIVELAQKGDLVITRDVPLAQRLVTNEIYVIDDRGRVFTPNNINELLSLRNFAVGLADNGLGIERIANYSKKEQKQFADSLDRLLTKLIRAVDSL